MISGLRIPALEKLGPLDEKKATLGAEGEELLLITVPQNCMAAVGLIAEPAYAEILAPSSNVTKEEGIGWSSSTIVAPSILLFLSMTATPPAALIAGILVTDSQRTIFPFRLAAGCLSHELGAISGNCC
ncbi:hypothetical protein IEQ34_014291 [Dendrobium chrysotoxum]|uniref:Uncharacterized protein n=1 Tax=Dendrobium chrysotoxum TaxID=161865 RepID=A0AAV7GL12_DENCH|nr:hypothetical protein IEQ34_014291 [Dendrobium chrysotoxum]